MATRLRTSRHVAIARSAETGKTDLEELVRSGLHESWDEYVKWRAKFLKKGSAKSVHKLRTSIRKLSSRLDLAGAALAPKQAERLRKCIDRELKCLGEVRDLQVQRKQLAESRPPFLRWRKYRRHIDRAVKKGIARACRRFEKWGYAEQGKCLQAIDKRLTKRLAGQGADERERMLAELKKRFDDTLRSFEHLQVDLRPGDHRAFHKLRIQVKDLDYKSELAHEVLAIPPSFTERVRSLKKSLGHLQDQVAFRELSRGYLRKGHRHPHPRRELNQGIVRQERALLGGLQ